MSINERLDELNGRLFGLEAKMTAFERVQEQDREYRKERDESLRSALHGLAEEVKADATRTRKLEIKIAAWGGGLAVLIVILKLFVK